MANQLLTALQECLEEEKATQSLTPSLFKLPLDALCLILFEWLQAKDLMRLASAATNYKARSCIKACIRYHFRSDITVGRDMTCVEELHRIAWLGRHGANITSIDCNPSMAESIFIKLLQPSITSISLFTCVNISSESVRATAMTCRALQYLNLSDCWLITDDCIKDIGQNMVNLLELNVSGCRKLTGSTLQEVGENIKLKVLDLSYCIGLQDFGLILFSHNGVSVLESLNISHCSSLTSDSFNIIFASCTSLCKLNMNGCCNCKESAISKLAESNHNLKELKASGCKDAINEYTVSMLSINCIKLERFDINDCHRITDSSISTLCCRCRFLSHIELSGCMLGDDAVVSISMLSSVINYLNISGTSRDITSPSTVILAQMCDRLQYLNISGSRCTDDVLQILATNCIYLNSLEMDSCKDLSSAAFSKPKFSRLTVLNVSSCRFNDQSISDICQNIPSLSVLRLRNINRLTNTAILSVLGAYPLIKELDIAWLPGISARCLEPLLWDSFERKLCYLDLGGCSQVTDTALLAQLVKKYGDAISLP